MFFPIGMYTQERKSCPNCGAKGWEKQLKRKEPECERCGFKHIETKEGPAMSMTYCEGCACHYSNGCDTHPQSKQKKV